jgi:hypothetical protein
MPFDNTPPAPDVASSDAEGQKRPYTRPVLAVFGSVTGLTQGSGGSAADTPVPTPRQP